MAISNIRHLSGRLLIVTLSFFALLLILISLRIFLYQSALQLSKDFKVQNLFEITSIDSLRLSSRLDALSTSLNWICISASHDGLNFYNKQRGNCGTSWRQQRTSITIKEANNLVVDFTIRLAPELEYGGLLFVCIQMLTIVSLISLARSEEREISMLQRSLGELAAQVAHDLRSPISAMRLLSSSAESLPVETKNLFHAILIKIESMANELMEKAHSRKLEQEPNANLKMEAIEINQELKLIAAEKNLHWGKASVNLELKLLPEKFFFEANKIEFSRAIVNILQNSYEATNGLAHRKIEVSLTDFGHYIHLCISDNGSGMPPEVLKKLGRRGFTQKESGTGLGLYQAIKTITSIGGKVDIQSTSKVGTQVKITLANISQNITPT